MKLKICSPQLGLNPNSILGGEVYDYQILKGLATNGVNVHIILPNGNTRLPISKIPAFLFNFLLIPYIFKAYKQNHFQIIRLHAPYFTGIGALFFRLFHPQVKLVAVYHQARAGLFYDFFNRLFIRYWDQIITDSKQAKNSLVTRYYLKPQKIKPVYNGAPDYLKPVKYKKRKPTLLFMGLLTERKNPLFLIRLVNHLNQKKIKINLNICGSGPLRPQIIQLIKNLKLQKQIKITPPIFGPKKQKLYDQADIFVHPSLHEGFPLVVIEAMTCGLPIVISKAPWAKEAIDHKLNGFLAETNSLNDWTEYITQLANNPSLRKKIGQNARKKALVNFTWSIAAKKQFQLLNKLIQK